MLSTSTSTSIQDGPGTTKCPLWHKVPGVSLRCRCRYKCRLKSKIHRGDSSDQLKHGIWKSLPLDKLKGECSMPMFKGGAWVLIHWANCRHAVSGYCPGLVCCPGPLILSAAGVSAWRFQHWGHGQLLGEGCSKPWSFWGKKYICQCLNADGGGSIGYCDSLWCGGGDLWREIARYITCSLTINSLVKQGLAWDKAPLLERSPLEILQELGYACLPSVLPCHKPCSFTLHCF